MGNACEVVDVNIDTKSAKEIIESLRGHIENRFGLNL